MTYRLSLLDKSPIAEGGSAAKSLKATVTLAQKAEQLGFERFWIAEHHGTQALASSAPEVVAAFVLANTSRIRVGSGGVMLQHYAPYKVAEAFHVLASLAPGRVDLGVGKAPGGLPFSTRALRGGVHEPRDFAELLEELNAFLNGALPESHLLSGAIATPVPPQKPERILLGASAESAELAARLGWLYCHAGHLNGDPALIERAFSAYAAAGGHGAPLLALLVLVAETAEIAERQLGQIRVFKVHLPSGQSVNLPSLEAAAEFARQAGAETYRVEENRPHVISGTAAHVRSELDKLSARFGVEEFVIEVPVPDLATRLSSLELLADARQNTAA